MECLKWAFYVMYLWINIVHKCLNIISIGFVYVIALITNIDHKVNANIAMPLSVIDWNYVFIFLRYNSSLLNKTQKYFFFEGGTKIAWNSILECFYPPRSGRGDWLLI